MRTPRGVRRLCAMLVLLGALPSVTGCGDSSTAPSVPNFQGQWSGIWTRQSCNESGSAVGAFCSQLAGSGPLTLTLTQSGRSANGTLALGTILIPVSGPIGNDGALTLTGQSNQSLGTFSVTTWRSTISGSNMTGSFSWSIQPPASLGFGLASISSGLQGVVRTG